MGAATQKARGTYYTDPVVASFLVAWAVRTSTDRVLEPCFGGGVFLRAAKERVAALQGDAAAQVTGVELDPVAHAAMVSRLGQDPRQAALILSDFFDLESEAIGRFSAVVGNPPFIRYQRFRGSQRATALKRAAAAGVKLTALTSAWAPFLVHASTFLESGGRLAMVAPAELCHAVYARAILAFLRKNFGAARVLTFERRLFPELNEDTVLILADRYGETGDDLRLISLPDASKLTDPDRFFAEEIPMRAVRVKHETRRLIGHVLPDRVQQLYERLLNSEDVVRFKDLAGIGIGYVTGNNEFFHLSAPEAAQLLIPDIAQTRAVCRGGWLRGLIFGQRDWTQLDRAGLKTRLLNIRPPVSIRKGSAIDKYLDAGKIGKVDQAYKCRVRDPWYAVPHVEIPHLFLTYMSNVRPALVVNRARAVAPNTLLCVRIRNREKVIPEALAATWWTSLTLLSCEVEGHSLGGGMLKLEPREALEVALSLPALLRDRERVRLLTLEMDRLVRDGAADKALDLGDEEILRRGLGLNDDECRLLRDAGEFLMTRRRSR